MGARNAAVTQVETSGRKIVVRLEKDGWSLVRHGTDHDIYRHPQRGEMIAVPRHRDISVGTSRSIAKKAGWL
jgi:predicted RNA binding protein YcfA (HicA-like mRNA interferase family)